MPFEHCMTRNLKQTDATDTFTAARFTGHSKEPRLMIKILQGIGAVFALVTAFFGMMYILGGDILLSALVSLVLTTLLFFLVEQLVQRKVEVTKQRFSIASLFLWISYILISIPLSLLLLHSLNVEIYHRQDIQAAAASKEKALNGMLAAYQTEVDDQLVMFQAAIGPLLHKYATDPGSELSLTKPPFAITQATLDAITLADVPLVVSLSTSARSTLFSMPDADIKTRNAQYVASYGKVFTNWERLKVPIAYSELDSLLAKNLRELQATFNKHKFDPSSNFTYSLPSATVLMDKPLALWVRHRPYPLLLAVVFFHVLLLLPFILKARPGVYDTNEEQPLHLRFPEAFEF